MKYLFFAAMLIVVACGPACRAPAAHAQSKTAAKPETLDKLLAPVALYPDSLLAQMLLCAGDPASVTRLSQWLDQHTTLKGTELQDEATVDGFEASFVALALFPQVVKYMADRIDWTTQLGKAFTADKTGVFTSIQRLRAQAHNTGALKSTPQQTVESKTTSGGQEVIVIEPANPQVIYVPQYNPTVVYTQPATTTVVVEKEDNSAAVAAGVIGFTAGIALGAAMDNNYYYGPYGWHGGAYMYNDAWDDYYDAREDARDDWQDHRKDLVEERGDRAKDAREQRTERTESRQDTRQEGQGQRTERTENRQQTRQQNGGVPNTESRGYSGGSSKVNRDRSGTGSDAFSGYSSGRSQKAASTRGQTSRGSRGGGGRRR